ncbi:MAG: hypothetical protein PHT53_01250, partial [Candidatus Omnitrophica bacterium]|nr:hypothetical protein [Candidatus Omnitrophota bacterium]
KVESRPSKLPDASSSLLQQSKKINFPFYALIGACVIFTVFIALSAYFSNRNLQSEAVKNYLAKKEIEKTKNEISLPLMTSIAQAKAGANTLSSVNPVADNPSPNKPDYPVYSLQGIVYDESSPSAIINGKTLRKSEAIDDFIVTDIAPTTVTLKNSKTDKELALSF